MVRAAFMLWIANALQQNNSTINCYHALYLVGSKRRNLFLSMWYNFMARSLNFGCKDSELNLSESIERPRRLVLFIRIRTKYFENPECLGIPKR